MDCKEELIKSVTYSIFNLELPTEQVNKISDILLTKLKDYEVTHVSKDVSIIDTDSENMLKIYAGTLLTEGKSKKTIRAYLSLLNRFKRDINKPLREINVFDIRLWFAELQRSNSVSLRTCSNYQHYLSAFYQWLFREEFISNNPMSKIETIKYENVLRYEFSDIELDMLRGACKTLRERAILELLLSSGIRVTELCEMNQHDINFNTLEVLVRHGKGNKQRKVYITDVCMIHLQKYLESRNDDFPFLFITRNHTRLTKSSAERELKRIGKRAGIMNVHPHRCRRTFATLLAKKGMDIRTIQTLMGHENVNTTMRYISINNAHAKSEYMRLSGF